MTLAPGRQVAALAITALLACAAASSLAAWRWAPDVGQAAAAWPGNYLVQSFVRWDAGWYEMIATRGYWHRPGVQTPVAFFPVYPLTVRAVTWLGLDVWLAGILVAAAAGLGGVALFFRWARELADAETARRATVLLIVYPFSLYLYGVMYSDALYLFLATGAFLCLERGKLGLATLLGAFATATRSIGPALVLALVLRQLERQRQRGEPWRLRDFAPLAAAAGFLAYVAFLGQRFGDPLAFVHVQAAPGWDQTPGWHSWLKLTIVEVLSGSPSPFMVLRYAAHAGVTLLLLALVPATWKRVSPAYALYLLLAVGMPALSSKDFMGMGRYALAGFPVFLTLAHLLGRFPCLSRAWIALSAALLLFLAAGFGAVRYVS